MKCKHKHTEITNEEIGGYNIPDGCTTEYDVYCKDCNKIIAHWAYGSFDDPIYIIKHQVKGFNKIRALFRYYIIETIKQYFLNKRIKKLCNKENFPF